MLLYRIAMRLTGPQIRSFADRQKVAIPWHFCNQELIVGVRSGRYNLFNKVYQPAWGLILAVMKEETYVFGHAG